MFWGNSVVMSPPSYELKDLLKVSLFLISSGQHLFVLCMVPTTKQISRIVKFKGKEKFELSNSRHFAWCDYVQTL